MFLKNNLLGYLYNIIEIIFVTLTLRSTTMGSNGVISVLFCHVTKYSFHAEQLHNLDIFYIKPHKNINQGLFKSFN